jgi:hypothetical protein
MIFTKNQERTWARLILADLLWIKKQLINHTTHHGENLLRDENTKPAQIERVF